MSLKSDKLEILLGVFPKRWPLNIRKHYSNIPMIYVAIFHGYKHDNFQMIKCDIFSSPELKAHR